MNEILLFLPISAYAPNSSPLLTEQHLKPPAVFIAYPCLKVIFVMSRTSSVAMTI